MYQVALNKRYFLESQLRKFKTHKPMLTGLKQKFPKIESILYFTEGLWSQNQPTIKKYFL